MKRKVWKLSGNNEPKSGHLRSHDSILCPFLGKNALPSPTPAVIVYFFFKDILEVFVVYLISKEDTHLSFLYSAFVF